MNFRYKKRDNSFYNIELSLGKHSGDIIWETKDTILNQVFVKSRTNEWLICLYFEQSKAFKSLPRKVLYVPPI